MRNDKAERDSTGRIKPGKTAPYVKKGMVNRLDLWYTDYIHIDEKSSEDGKNVLFLFVCDRKKKTGGALAIAGKGRMQC